MNLTNTGTTVYSRYASISSVTKDVKLRDAALIHLSKTLLAFAASTCMQAAAVSGLDQHGHHGVQPVCVHLFCHKGRQAALSSSDPPVQDIAGLGCIHLWAGSSGPLSWPYQSPL